MGANEPGVDGLVDLFFVIDVGLGLFCLFVCLFSLSLLESSIIKRNHLGILL